MRLGLECCLFSPVSRVFVYVCIHPVEGGEMLNVSWSSTLRGGQASASGWAGILQAQRKVLTVLSSLLQKGA